MQQICNKNLFDIINPNMSFSKVGFRSAGLYSMCSELILTCNQRNFSSKFIVIIAVYYRKKKIYVITLVAVINRLISTNNCDIRFNQIQGWSHYIGIRV